MGEKLSISSEDYLEAIYELSEKSGQVRNTDLAGKMSVSKASISKAVGLLCLKGYVSTEKYGQIALTESGSGEAKRILAKHETLRKFLTEHLGVSKEVAEVEACKMEHILSDDTIGRIAAHICGIKSNDERTEI